MTARTSLLRAGGLSNGPQTLIDYRDSELAWQNVKSTIQAAIIESGAKRVLEVGAGANPLFPEEFLIAHKLDYTALDISATELAKAPDCYRKMVTNICDDKLPVDQQFDFIFSRMLAEHVPSGEAFHRNVYKLLAPGGRAFHFFPTMWAPPYVLNRFLPERLAEALLHLFQRGRERHGKVGKFPAFYSWCRGPLPGQIKKFEALGYQVESYIGHFGHRGYYLKFPPLLKVHDWLTGWLLANPQPWLTSFAYLTLRRPQQ